MERVQVNGVELEYDVHGSGEPVLLVHGGLLADENTPLALEPALTDRYMVINYHRRGFAGSSRPSQGQPPATIETHVADAKALLDELGVEKTHVVGHSLGGTISIQLALDHPDTVHTLALMEPAIMAAVAKSQASPEEAKENQQKFMDGMAHVNEIYATGDKRAALTAFLETRAGQAFREVLDWLTTTGEFDQAVKDADTFLQVEMPAAYRWNFTPADAKRLTLPVLSILGSHSPERAQKVHGIFLQWVPHAETLVLPHADHALPLMDPPGIAQALTTWLAKHPIGVPA
jgi:pimeloyl-ACP methyl ester carboxylesterase